MAEEVKAKRKRTRRPKVEPMAVYAVMVKVTRGRKVETIYAESTRVENGCLVVVSMDGPQPLVEKVRYIPFGSAEIEVCARPQQYQPRIVMDQRPNPWMPSNAVEMPHGGFGVPTQAGPQIVPGPLELARQREAQGLVPKARPQSNLVERNADGVAVVTAGFLDGSPT